MLHDALVDKNSVLEEAINTLSDFNKYVALVKKRGDIVLFHDSVGGLLERYSRVLIAVKGCAKIYIFDIGSHKSGTGCLDCAEWFQTQMIKIILWLSQLPVKGTQFAVHISWHTP